jgi:hypothetical protein
MKTISATMESSGLAAFLTGQIREILPGSTQLPPIALAKDTLFLPDPAPATPARRLVVLVPPGEIDEGALARRVWQLADSSKLGILYLALSPPADQVSYHRRRLVTLAALSAYSPVRADIRMNSGKDWPQALRSCLQPGDLLVCMADGHQAGIFQRQPPGKRLAQKLGTPVYKFGDVQVKPATSSEGWFRNVLAWILSIAWMAAFFWLQAGIERASPNPQATVLMCLSIIIEIYGLWKINQWIG